MTDPKTTYTFCVERRADGAVDRVEAHGLCASESPSGTLLEAHDDRGRSVALWAEDQWVRVWREDASDGMAPARTLGGAKTVISMTTGAVKSAAEIAAEIGKSAQRPDA